MTSEAKSGKVDFCLYMQHFGGVAPSRSGSASAPNVDQKKVSKLERMVDAKLPELRLLGIPKFVENPLPPLPHPSAGSSQDVLGGQVLHLGCHRGLPKGLIPRK